MSPPLPPPPPPPTAKVRKTELSFLYANVVPSCSTFLSSTIKIFQMIFELQSGHEIYFKQNKGNNSKSKKARVVILVHDTLSCPVLHFYQVSSKYSKGYSSYRLDKKFYADTDADANGIRPKKNNMSPPPHPTPHSLVHNDNDIRRNIVYNVSL